MSGRRVKSVRRQVKKVSQKIVMEFLGMMRTSSLKVRFVYAFKILFKRFPQTKKERNSHGS